MLRRIERKATSSLHAAASASNGRPRAGGCLHALRGQVAVALCEPPTIDAMGYDLRLHCGCVLHVTGDPGVRAWRRRVIIARGVRCAMEQHQTGRRLFLWQLLPQPRVDRLVREDVDVVE
jgi:hypothetical protein